MVEKNNKKYLEKLGLILILCLVAFILRWQTFGAFILDDDEGIYLLMGRLISDGFLPYTAFWDHQMPLIYLVSSFPFFIEMDYGLFLRVCSLVCCVLGAFGISIALSQIFYPQKKWIFSGGLLYIFLTSLFDFGGLAFNNEILFNGFTSISLYLLIKSQRSFHKKTLIVSGFLIGLGLITKAQAVFDFLILGVGLYIFLSRGGKKERIKKLSYYAFGSMIPVILLILIYLLTGNLDLFWDANITSNFGYMREGFVGQSAIKNSLWLFTNIFLILLVSLLCMAFLAIGRGKTFLRNKIAWNWVYYLLTWSGLSISACFLSGLYFSHYFLQALLPLCLLWGYCFELSWMNIPWKGRFLSLLVVLLFALCNLQGSHLLFWPAKIQSKYLKVSVDPVREVGNFIKHNVKEKERIFVLNSEVAFYCFSPTWPLTKYAFPSHLLSMKHGKSFRLDPYPEYLKIFEQKPKWIIVDQGTMNHRKVEDPKSEILITQALKTFYREEKQFSSSNKAIDIRILKRVIK